jgi:hypothetical protein
MGGSKQPSNDVVGLLFGVQNGLEVAIVDATEALYTIEDGQLAFDGPSLVKKKELCKCSMHHLAWYEHVRRVIHSFGCVFIV